MNYKYFETSEGIASLLVKYEELFNMIEDLGQQLKEGILVTTDQYREALNQFTGIYIALEPLYSTSIAYKENAELKFYVERKREIEAKGEKVVATSLEKEASYSVEELRRIRNICEGYVNACEKGIMTCQTQLKRIEADNKFKPNEEQ
jgi:hypothetical protein